MPPGDKKAECYFVFVSVTLLNIKVCACNGFAIQVFEYKNSF